MWPSRNASCDCVEYTRCTALPECESRNVNMWHFVFTPARTTHTSPKSTSASAPGACSCGTNTSDPAAALRRRSAHGGSGRSPAPSSTTAPSRRARRPAGRAPAVAVCRCFRGASRSSRSIASITGLNGSNRGAVRTGVFFGGGSGDASACGPCPGRHRAGGPAPESRAPRPARHVGSVRTGPPETPSVLHPQQSEITVPITVEVGPA